MIKHWNHVVHTTNDKPVCLCPDAETATEIAQALENQKPLKELVKYIRGLKYPGYLTDLIKPFENQFK